MDRIGDLGHEPEVWSAAVLLERDIESGLVDVFLDGVRADEGRILVLEGARGIGKTALLY